MGNSGSAPLAHARNVPAADCFTDHTRNAGRSGARQTSDTVRHVSLCRLAKTSCSDRDGAFGHAEEGAGQRSGHLVVRAASADISASNAFA